MRILVVNANTSQSVTDTVAAEARVAASPDTEIVAVTGTFGARVISTRAENAIAQHALLAVLAEHHAGCDAAVIGVSYDTGLAAARELLPIPVVGMTEAALLIACTLGSRLGIVTFGRRTAPLYRELVESYGLAQRLAGLRTIEVSALEMYRDPEAVQQAALDTARALVEQDGCEAVILSGAAMAGMGRRLQAGIAVPLVDGVSCAVRLAELLVRLGLPKPGTGSYAAVPAKEQVGLSPALTRLFGA